MQASHSVLNMSEYALTESRKQKTKNHNSRKIQEQKTLKGKKKSVVILGDSKTRLINGWEMTKRIQSDCKIYVKTFSGATVSCMEDYMKVSLRNPPHHFILHFWTKDLSPQQSCMEIAESIINPAYWLKKEIHDVNVSTIIIYRQIFRFLRKLVKIMGKIDNSCFGCYKKWLVLGLQIFLFLSLLFFFSAINKNTRSVHSVVMFLIPLLPE